MGTRSFLARKNNDGTVTYNYCHWDGYPSNNGNLLLDHYTDPDKVDKLMALGSLSYLSPKVGRKHSFDKLNKTMCTAYHRDRGEELEIRTAKSPGKMVSVMRDSWAEYAYMFDNKEGWMIWNAKRAMFVKLTKEICELASFY